MKLLLASDSFALVDAQRDALRLGDEAEVLMLRSALRHGASVGYWLGRVADEGQALALAQATLLMPEGAGACQSLAMEAEDLAPLWLDLLIEKLARAWRAGKGTTRACASDALWALHPYLPRSLWLRLALSRAPRLMRRIALPATGVLLGALAIILIVWGPRWFTPKPEIAWVDIPAGTYIIGSDPDKDQWSQVYERPQHRVSLDAYSLMQYEVTNAQYARCIESTVCEGEVEGVFADPEDAQYPVVNVTWFQA